MSSIGVFSCGGCREGHCHQGGGVRRKYRIIDFKRNSKDGIVAKVNDNDEIAVGDVVCARPKPNKLHFFDAETEERIPFEV